jgi:hypothetical protein
MRAVRIVQAKGPWRLLLRLTGCAAVTMPWRTIYVLPEHLHDEALLAHELVHIEQIEREGAVTFSIKYMWWLATKGYRENPFEVEAYSRAPL